MMTGSQTEMASPNFEVEVDDGKRNVKTYVPGRLDPVIVLIDVFGQDNVANVKASIFRQHAPTLIPEKYNMIGVAESEEHVMIDDRGIEKYNNILEQGILKFTLRTQT